MKQNVYYLYSIVDDGDYVYRTAFQLVLFSVDNEGMAVHVRLATFFSSACINRSIEPIVRVMKNQSVMYL